MREALLETGQAQTPQCGPGLFRGFRRRKAQIERPEGHILQDRGEKELILGMLEHKAHLAAQGMEVLFIIIPGLSVEAYQPLAGTHQPGDAAEQGRFAAAVGPVKTRPLTGGQRE